MYKVLIVDDEWMIREGLKKVVPWETLEIGQVSMAATGQDALAKIEDEMPDILVTDISMPEMSGLNLIERALEIAPELRILVLTGYDSFEYARECLRLQVQDFLLKPIDEDVLSNCVRKQVAYLKEQEQRREQENMLLRTKGLNAQIELESIMRDLVNGKDKEEAVRLLESKFNMKKDINLMAAVLLPAQDIGDVRQDKMLQLSQIQNICRNVIDAKGLGISFPSGEDRKIMIALYADKCGLDSTGVLSELLGILKSEFSYAPKTAVGSEVVGFENLDISYQEAMYLLENDKMEIHQILQSPNVIKRHHIFQEVYEELKGEMCANISDYTYVMRVFDTFCMAAESYNLSAASVRKYCFELIADVYYSHVTAGGTRDGQNLENFLQSLSGANGGMSLELGRQYLLKMIGSEEKDVHEIIVQAKRYINLHLAENLSVSDIAEKYFVSLSYFSRLFKRETGEGCNEYIMRKRMEKACVLLETTNFNTQEIAPMVGYNDRNYFSMAFKKYCGMSPTSYRSEKRK